MSSRNKAIGEQMTMYTAVFNTQILHRYTAHDWPLVGKLKGQRNLRTLKGHSISLASRIEPPSSPDLGLWWPVYLAGG